MSVSSSPAYTEIPAQAFGIRRAMRSSIRLYGEHFFKIVLIGLFPMIIIIPVMIVMVGSIIPIFILAGSGADFGTWIYLAMLGLVMIAAFVIITYIPFAIITAGTVQALATGAFALRSAIVLGFRRVIPLVGVALLFIVPVFFSFLVVSASGRVSENASLVGILLSIIALVYLGVRYFLLAAPVTVIERLGPVASLRRSGDLTRGRGWRVFGIVLVTMLLYVVFSILLSALVGEKEDIGSIIVSVVVFSALNGIFPVTSGVTYYLLRREKDGPGGELAEVFG